MISKMSKIISITLMFVMLCGIIPTSFAAETNYGFVKVDVKKQATGIIYMDSTTEGNSLGKSNYTAIDLIDGNGTTSSTRTAIITSDRSKLSSVEFDGTTVPFDITPKRAVSSDLTDKEAIMVKDASNNVQIDMPDGHYSDLYFVAFTAAADNASAQIKLNYSDSEATVTQPIYGYNKTYAELSNAVLAASGTRLELPLWMGSYYTYTSANAKYYVYKIPADNTKLLENFNITVTNNSTAIIGITGKLDINAEKAYVESLLAGNDTSIEANLEKIKTGIETLESVGVSRDSIEGISALLNLEKTFVKVDVKEQATGIIYMDSNAEGNSQPGSSYTAVDLVDSNGATTSTREAIITSDRSKLSSVAFDGTTVPFDIAPKRAVSSDLTDKEAIMVKDASNNVQIDIPDGYYGDLYFVAFTAAKDGASAQIKLNYSDSEATITQPIYGYNKTYTELSNAVLAASGIRLEMPLWQSGIGSYTSATAKYYVYKIPADNTKLLKSFNITATNNSTAIIGITGSMFQYKTKAYLEGLLANGSEYIEANFDDLNSIVDGLIAAGINRADIEGIENLKISRKAFIKVDVKEQATGIIYMDSNAEGNSQPGSSYTAVDLVDSNGATTSTREAIITSDRSKLSSVAFDGTTVPFDIAPKRAVSSDLTDKEAIMVKDASNNVQIDIPDGYYGDLYFVAFTAAKDDASAQIKLNYSDSESTVTQPIYGYNKTYTELSNAVLAASGTRLEMPLWQSVISSYTSATAKYYVYKIPADNTKLLKSFNITATNNSTAIIGITGKMFIDETLEYVEDKIATNTLSTSELIAIDGIINTLVEAGESRETIDGIADFDEAWTKAFGKVIISDAAATLSGTTLTYSGNILNERLESVNYDFVVAIYENIDANTKRLADTDVIENNTLTKGQTAPISGNFTNLDANKTYTIKYIVVSDFENMEPLASAATPAIE